MGALQPEGPTILKFYYFERNRKSIFHLKESTKKPSKIQKNIETPNLPPTPWQGLWLLQFQLLSGPHCPRPVHPPLQSPVGD
jgi:hypothetical protein